MEILDLREINKGCLKASFKLKLNLFDKSGRKVDSFTECVYFEKDDGSGWINIAPKEYTANDGRKKTYNMHGWDEETTKMINKGVREKIKSGDFQKKVPKAESYSQFGECPF